jgi:hypothetical protein
MRRWLVQKLVDFLTRPLYHYERREWNDPGALKRHCRKGDVVLLEGDQRISAVIKYLTQSSWSHSVLYIGDEALRRGGELARRAREEFGAEAEHLIIEALPEGVVLSPLMKYIDLNLRVCRPHHLRPDHLKLILDRGFAALGWRYDLRNLLDLATTLVPMSLLPARYRGAALRAGSGTPTEVICSSLIGQLFQNVGFPVLPTIVHVPDGDPGGAAGLRRLFARPRPYAGIFRNRHPTLLTPRDFDLSPFFEVVKFNAIADGYFDYQRIRWADGDDGEGAS